MSTLKAVLAVASFPEIEAMCELMREFVFDKDSYEERLNALPTGLARAVNSRQLWSSGMFDLMTLNQLLLTFEGCKLGVKESIVRILISNGIENSLLAEISSDRASYWFSRDNIELFIQQNILKHAIINRIEYTAASYRQAVLAIEVQKEGDVFIGTGFLYNVSRGAVIESYFITAKHNIDPQDGIEIISIKDADDRPLATLGDWVIHPEIDIAVAKMESVAPNSFCLAAFAMVLAETVSLGYPSVPTTDKPYLLAHRGEINAKVKSYLRKGDYILISNEISPGSSGSPVVDKLGRVLGIVTDSFESGYDPGKFPNIARAAIDVSEIRHFVENLPSD